MMTLIDEMSYDTSFSFIYSPRPGTPAANLHDDTPREVKLKRLQHLQATIEANVQRRSAIRCSARCSAFWSKARRARTRTNSPGRTENNRVVNFPAPVESHARLIGQMIDVEINHAYPHSLRGELVMTPDHDALSSTRQDTHVHLEERSKQHLEFTAPREDNARLANLCGPLDENLRQIEQALDVTLSRRGHKISIRGRGAKVALAALENFYNRARDPISVDDIQLALVEARHATRRARSRNGNGNGEDSRDRSAFSRRSGSSVRRTQRDDRPRRRRRSTARSSTRAAPTCAAARPRSASI